MSERSTPVELTKKGTQEIDWQKVVNLNPQGYMELNDTNIVIHGPVESVIIDDNDNVVITLKWAAEMPYVGKPGFGTWKNAPQHKKMSFPNLMADFVIEDTPNKGPRVRFGLNIM